MNYDVEGLQENVSKSGKTALNAEACANMVKL
jgi:hypothetical protein